MIKGKAPKGTAWPRGGPHRLMCPIARDSRVLSQLLPLASVSRGRKNKRFYVHFMDEETEAQTDGDFPGGEEPRPFSSMGHNFGGVAPIHLLGVSFWDWGSGVQQDSLLPERETLSLVRELLRAQRLHAAEEGGESTQIFSRPQHSYAYPMRTS